MIHIAVLVGCLALAFAVFAWGLNAKLSLYSPSAEPSNATVAKLLLSQRPQAAVTSASDRHSQPGELLQLALLLLGAALVVPELQIRWMSIKRRRMNGTDFPVPLRLLSRPPPAHHLAR